MSEVPDRMDRGLVLVVDDDVSTCGRVAAMLAREGFRVLSAYGGIEAIELFERHAPDIVLLDVMLPDLYGFEVARAVKRIASGRFVPVIFLSSLSESEAIAQCVESGGDDFLHKPIEALVLRAKVAAIERTRDLYEKIRRQHAELSELHARMQFEQSIAEQILLDAVMASNVAIPPIRSCLRAATSFNGDLFISCRTPDGGIALLLGDFTGHGLMAALGALPTSETFRAMMGKGFALLDTLAEMNRKLNRLLPAGIFLAAAAIHIDRDLRHAQVWNSGMPEVVLCGGDGSRRMIASHHPPLGVLPEFLPDSRLERIGLAPGDGFILCSDGLTEACNAAEEAFGEERLMALLAGRNAVEAFDALYLALAEFVGEAEQRDDISLIAVPCVPELLAAEDDWPEGERIPAAAWQWSLRLDGASLRRTDPIPLLIAQLRVSGLPAHHVRRIHGVVAELFGAALDHGVLGLDPALKEVDAGAAYYRQRQLALDALDTGFVSLSLGFRPEGEGGQLSIRVEDSGPGRGAEGRRVDAEYRI